MIVRSAYIVLFLQTSHQVITSFPNLNLFIELRYPFKINSGCSMPTGEAFSTRQLKLFFSFWTCIYIIDNVENNIFQNLL